MKISYAVTVCNELVEIERLLPFLIENKRKEDEIVVFFDTNNGLKSVEDYLRAKSVNTVPFRWFGYHFDGHFANMKNALTEACLGNYVYQIDADEMISEYVMKILPQVLEANDVDVVRVPRINTVKGLTQEHVAKWKWHLNERGWVNFPDYQWRIYKNIPQIRWQNKVHEILTGYETLAVLPTEEEWCLYHHKDIERQERQNSYYETL